MHLVNYEVATPSDSDDIVRPARQGVRRVRTELSTDFLPIFSTLEMLDEQFRRGRAVSPGEYVHLFMFVLTNGLQVSELGKDWLKLVSITEFGRAIEWHSPKRWGGGPSTYFARTDLRIVSACHTGTSSKTKLYSL